MSSTVRHRKSSSEPSSPLRKPQTTQPVISMVERSDSQQVQVTSLSITSLLTTLATTEAITTTAKKLYTYPTKTLSSSELWKRYKSDEEGLSLSSSTSPGSVTPPPDYEEESLAVTSSAQPAAVGVTSSAMMPITLPLPHLATQPELESASLVSAKFATQGHNLLSLSLSEPSNSTFRRHLYLDSVTYILRALPSDLSPAESTQVLSALPPPLIAYLQPQTPRDKAVSQHMPIEHPTVHRLLSIVTSMTVSTVRNLTPHVKSLAQSTWEYNLKYRVTERGLQQIKSTLDGNFRFWRAVAEWVMFEECDQVAKTDGEERTVARRKMRYGGGVVRDVGRYAGGVVKSGVEGVMEGFVEGMKV